MSEPAAWARSFIFPEDSPSRREIEDHCCRHAISDIDEQFVPVRWLYRTPEVVWEYRTHLVPHERDLRNWNNLRQSEMARLGERPFVDCEDERMRLLFLAHDGVSWNQRNAAYLNPNHPKFDFRRSKRRDYIAAFAFLESIWNQAQDDVLRAFLEKFGVDFVVFEKDLLRQALSLSTGRPVDKVDLRTVLLPYCLDRLSNVKRSRECGEKQKRALRVIRKCNGSEIPLSELGRELRNERCMYCEDPIRGSHHGTKQIVLFHAHHRVLCIACAERFWNLFRNGSGELLERIDAKFDRDAFPRERTCVVCAGKFLYREVRNPLLPMYASPFPLTDETRALPGLAFWFANSITDVCLKCVDRCLAPNEEVARDAAIDALKGISGIVGREMLDGISRQIVVLRRREDYTCLLRLLAMCPNEERLKELFGHYVKALIESEVIGREEFRISDGGRGVRCIADDGHICHSLVEREIDNFLHENGIEHEREPKYPDSNFRADWFVRVGTGEHFVEYFGLAGNEEYDTRIERKIELASAHGISLISLYPMDDWQAKLRSNLMIRRAYGPSPRSEELGAHFGDLALTLVPNRS